MSLKDEAKAADASLRKVIKDSEQLGWLTVISKYNGELRSNLQLARADVARLTSEAKSCKDKAIAAEAKVEGLETTIESLKQQLAGTSHRLNEVVATHTAEQNALPDAEAEIAKAPHGAIRQNQLDRLRQGATISSGSPANWRERREQLIRVVERMLPDFAQAADSPVDVVYIHQDAFAAGYHADEYALLGMAVKYMGLRGRAITINGRNGQTFEEPSLEETAATKADRRPWYRRMWRGSKD